MRRIVLFIYATVACADTLAGAPHAAQVASQRATGPAFEVAVIKPSDPQSLVANGMKFSPNRLTAVGTLRDLLELAYGLREFQIVEGPTWLRTDSFDIDAKSERPVSPDQLKLMLRSLLAERFKLRLHSEDRDVPLYALVVSKKGPKLREVFEEIGTMSGGAGWLSGKLTLSALAQQLTSTVGRTVEDRTNIAGAFDIKLAWAPDGNNPAPDEQVKPSIFVAVQEQLGLKLESTRGPVKMMVIDRAERPSEN